MNQGDYKNGKFKTNRLLPLRIYYNLGSSMKKTTSEEMNFLMVEEHKEKRGGEGGKRF
ncbi:MAG: hypothetical protein ACO1OQ_15065 [Rufibacter sp.]